MNKHEDIVFKNLRIALEILEHEGVSKEQWVLGGGISLYLLFWHRLSKDVDIFFRDVQLLGLFSPRLNDWIEEIILDYEEGPVSIKLKFSDFEIDFIVTGNLTIFKPVEINLFSSTIYIEHPIETAAKKIYYKGVTIKPRDLVDLAFIYENYRELPKILIENKLIPEPKEFFLKTLRSKIDSLDNSLNELDLIKKFNYEALSELYSQIKET